MGRRESVWNQKRLWREEWFFLASSEISTLGFHPSWLERTGREELELSPDVSLDELLNDSSLQSRQDSRTCSVFLSHLQESCKTKATGRSSSSNEAVDARQKHSSFESQHNTVAGKPLEFVKWHLLL